MTITLPSDLQTYMEDVVSSGEFDDASMVVAMALRYWRSERERVLALIQEGIDSADRGELRDGPAFMAELLECYGEGATKVPEAA